MLFKRQVAVFLIPGLICFAACPAWAEANKPDSNVESDTQAKMQLDQMASKLASAKRFSVSMLMNYDVVQESGQKIQFSEVRKVLIDRPNHLRVDAKQSNGDEGGLIFDGKVLTLYNTGENVYSQTDVDGTVDGGLRYAVGKLGVRIPLARMLVTTLPQELEKLNSQIDFVELNTLGAEPTDHIAARTETVDYQVWIASDMLPRQIVITYKDEPGQPQFQADFSDWNLSPSITSSSFTYHPPKGAEKIRTLMPASMPRDIGDNKWAVK